MKKKLLLVLLSLLICMGTIPLTALAADDPTGFVYEEIDAYRKNFKYLSNDGKIGIPAAVTAYYKGEKSNADTSVVLYVMGYVGAKEVGKEDTLTILQDLLDEGYIVVTLDYIDDPRATTPNLDWSIQNVRMNIRSYIPKDLTYDSAEVYVVPDGYRLARNIVYYDFAENSRKGTLDRIIDVYNNGSGFRTSKGSKIPNPNEVVTSIDRCLKPDGTPIDLQLKLDIIYPSESEIEAPMVMISSSSETRMTICSTNKVRPLDVGALTRGCAVAVYDHVYTPMARTDHYGYFSGSFTQDSYTGVSSHTQASRAVHYYADKFGYSRENYAVMGHSKGSMCGILAAPDVEELDWGSSGTYKYDEYYGEQGFLAYDDGTPIDSQVTVAYRSMGSGAQYHNKYLNAENAPTILCVGVADQYGSWDYWPTENMDYERVGIDYLPIAMSDLGHAYPYGIDPEYGYDRFMAFMDFLMYYLKGDQAPRILYASVVDGKLMGDVEITRHDKAGTKDFSHATIEKGDELFVQFLAPVTDESAKAGILLFDVTAGKEVAVDLQSMVNGSKWYLFPESALASGHKYEIRVSDTVKSVKNGMSIGAGAVFAFVAK